MVSGTKIASVSEITTLAPESFPKLPVEAENPDVHQTYRNYQLLVDRVDDVFGNALTASAWLSTPNPDFSGHTPLEIARNANYDVQVLEPVLIRLEHGVYF